MNYRSEIDGLRALAVIPVIFFHAGFNTFSGGFVGVDVFFVISGYLITSIIVNDIENKNFSIISFYERRARRILPALFLVMLACLPFAWMWMVPIQLKDFSQSMIAVSLFASNFLFWRESGYFDAAAEEKPLLHTWSLAVEEQYYLIFPIFLLMMWGLGKNKVFWLIIILATASLIFSEWSWRNTPSANFFLAPTRAWELFAGSIAAFIVKKRGVQKSSILSSLGLGAIILAIFAYDKTTPFPSFYTLLPILGVCLIIIYGDRATLTGKLLSTKALVGIGLISYSAYLWHQPLFAFARIRSLSHPSDYFMLLLCFVSILLAYISWKYVEKPFRNKNKFKRIQILFFSITGIIFFTSIGTLGHLGVIESKFNSIEIKNWRDENECVVSKKTDVSKKLNTIKEKCFSEDKNYILIGDSHAESLSKPLRKMIEIKNGSLITLLHNGCLPVVGTSRIPYQSDCVKNKELYWNFIQSTNATIIISARWRLQMEGPRFNNQEGGVEYGSNAVNTVIDSKTDIFEYVEEFFINASTKNQLIIINQIPEAGWNVPDRSVRIKKLYNGDYDISTSYDLYKKSNLSVNNIFSNLQRNPRISIVRSDDIVCNTKLAGRCLNTFNGDLLYRDDDHPSPIYASLIVNKIEDSISNQ